MLVFRPFGGHRMPARQLVVPASARQSNLPGDPLAGHRTTEVLVDVFNRCELDGHTPVDTPLQTCQRVFEQIREHSAVDWNEGLVRLSGVVGDVPEAPSCGRPTHRFGSVSDNSPAPELGTITSAIAV